MKPLKIVLVIALAALAYSCGSSDPGALLASAKQYMDKREYSASVIQLKNLLQQSPENAEARRACRASG